jgi:hypothetical protein
MVVQVGVYLHSRSRTDGGTCAACALQKKKSPHLVSSLLHSRLSSLWCCGACRRVTTIGVRHTHVLALVPQYGVVPMNALSLSDSLSLSLSLSLYLSLSLSLCRKRQPQLKRPCRAKTSRPLLLLLLRLLVGCVYVYVYVWSDVCMCMCMCVCVCVCVSE